MDSNTLQEYLDNVAHGKGFRQHRVLLNGALSATELVKPSIYIIFHDDHFYSLYITSNHLGKASFVAFDSLGKDPVESYGLKIPATLDYQFNDVQIQPFASSLCAVYCLYFVDQIAKGASLQRILRNFKRKNLAENDKRVCEYYSGLQKANKVKPFEFCKKQ